MIVRFYVRQGQGGPPPQGRELSTKEIESEKAMRIAEILQQEHLPVEILDVDSQRGQEMAGVYDVVSTPRIHVMRENGSIVKEWLPDEIPQSAGDVRYYLGLDTTKIVDARFSAKDVVRKKIDSNKGTSSTKGAKKKK